jgi:beta-lactamase regulating signal transducer with metallopeptidase domain
VTDLFSFAFTQTSAAAAGALVAAIWEGLCLAAAVALILRLLPGIPAAARSIVWSAVMLLVVALPFLHFGQATAAGALHSAVHAVHIDERISLALIALWAAASLFRAAELIRSALYLRRIARNSTTIATDAAIDALLHGGPRQVALCVSAEVDRPSVVGFFAPRILVPAALLDRLTAAELHQIVLHEMEHIRRRDDWTNLLQKLGLVLFPLNPVLVWVERRLCLERELACDDRVLRATGARKAYAACLASLAEHTLVRRGVSLALGAWERRPELVRRVHRILSGSGRTMRPRQTTAAVSLLLAGVLAGGDALAHSPQLISFAPAAPVMANATLPAAFPSPGAHFTAQPVKAKMPARAAFQPVQTVAVKIRRREIRKPLLAQQIAYDTRSLDQSPDPSGMIVMVTWRQVVSTAGAQPQAQSLQVRYAAVPTRNGWLFLQL